MISSIQAAMDTFKDESNSILRQIELVDFLCGLGAVPNGIVISKTQRANFRVIQRNFSGHMNATLRNSIANGAIILVSSYFEEFVRKAVAGGAGHLKSKKQHFKELNKSIQEAHLKEFSELLVERMRKNEIYSPEMVREVDNLNRCISGDISFAILADRIARNRRNITSQELGEICGRIGLKKIVEKLASESELQDYFGQYNVAVALGKTTEKLNNFMQQRNYITHGGSSRTSYATDWIRDHLQFFVILSQLLGRELDKFVA
jgi:hypothetical protein